MPYLAHDWHYTCTAVSDWNARNFQR